MISARNTQQVLTPIRRALPAEETTSPLALAKMRSEAETTGPIDAQTLLVDQMIALSRLLQKHAADMINGELVDLDAVADAASLLTQACRRRAIAELGLTDIGDAGSR